MRKIVQKKIRRSGGVDLVADINAVIATSTSGKSGGAGPKSRQSVRVVQSNGRTEVTTTDGT